MSKLKKMICLLITTLLFCTFSICTFASNETSEDSIQIQIATDKAEYKALGIAEITATITNTGAEQIENVTAQVVFNDLAPVAKRNSETRKSVDVLKAGESISFTYNATLNKEEHDLNIFQKIFLWLIRLFNGGYTATNNSIDVVAENVTDILFGKFTAKNVIQIGYDTIDVEEDNNNSNNSDDNNVTEIPTYEELIEDIDIDEIYEYDESDISIDNESGLTYLNNIIILMFEEECSEQERAEIINSINGKVVGGDTLYDELYIEIEKSTLAELETLCDELNSKYNVLAVYETAMTVDSQSLSNLPNDPWIGSDFVNWNVSNGYSISDSNWWILSTETQRAWNYNEYFNNINIGIVDIGFDKTHEDINMSIMSKENSYENHGTHVAGIIGATANNEKGISGIVHNKNLYGYSIGASSFDQIKENLFKTDIFKGLKVLVQNNCKVINFSLGFSGKLKNSDRVFIDKTINVWGEQASREIAKLLENGYDFIVTQSAGNGASDGKGVNALQNGLFCSITKDNCYSNKKVSVEQIMNRIIVVANANKVDNNNYQLSTDSNGGSKVDIAAPGTWIYSTLAGIEDANNLINAGQKYGQLSGTSMASPIVAGVASLVWSVNPNFNGAQVKEIVCSTAKDGGILVKDNPNSPTTGSFYLVNAKLAVEEAIKKTYWTCTVNGFVIDQNDEALANVNIVATDMDTNKKIVAQNNSDGTFTLLLPCGTYSISLSKYDTEVVVELDKTTYNQEIDLGEILMIIPETTVSGTVKDKDSQLPVSNVIIDVYNTESYEYANGVETDTNGYFEMEIPRDDSYTFTFYHDDYTEPYSMEVNAKTTPLDLGDIFLSKDGYTEDSRVVTETGSCGDNVTWTLYEDGELVISGSGETAEYGESYNDDTIKSPFWLNHSIKSIIVKEGVTSIGNYMFHSCDNLEYIHLPDSVTEIKKGAFWECKSLKSIHMSSNITNIEDYAFSYCNSLENITIPNKVTNIGYMTFYKCESLESVCMNDNVTTIGESAFENCSSLANIQIPDSVTSIGKQAFCNCTSLTNIIGANNVASIGSSVLMNATAYYENEENWHDSVLYLGSGAIDNNSETKDIIVKNGTLCIAPHTFSDSNFTKIILPEGLLHIGDRAFYNSDSLIEIEIPKTLKTIYGNAFESCNVITNIVLPENITMVGEIDFSFCEKLENIIIPKGVSNISYNAFDYCTSLTTVELPDTIETIDYGAFGYCYSLNNIIIPQGVTSIGDNAFRHCSSLSDITIPDSVTYIGANAFQYCYDLTEIALPNNIVTIKENTFKFCTYLKSVKMPENLRTIENGAFYGCYDLTDINIPTSVTSIGNESFMNCDDLISIIIPESTISIGNRAFCGCDNLMKITVDANNINYSSDDFGVLYNKDKTKLIQYPVGNSLINYSIPDSVLIIGEYAFYSKNCYSDSDTITIPENVLSIDKCAFDNCYYLDKFIILNPNCKIYDSSDTLFYLIDSNTSVIYSYSNSTAQAYAEKYGINFIALD